MPDMSYASHVLERCALRTLQSKSCEEGRLLQCAYCCCCCFGMSSSLFYIFLHGLLFILKSISAHSHPSSCTHEALGAAAAAAESLGPTCVAVGNYRHLTNHRPLAERSRTASRGWLRSSTCCRSCPCRRSLKGELSALGNR